ncbi:M56 family metallopeptidase [Roseateles sp.]|uniref:M56 family metallopeptidase n=1 Tax=Roseateles sp. TaxID=1971397 RepID=UPI0025E3EC05|nr:M56 family metallopeptidase [Roseateles sp.]MBV8034473.1 hypothetical protein [Roseateles sp.]
MTDALLTVLLRQALLLSLGIALLWALRPLLTWLGAGVVYAAWLLVPVLLLTPALPRPAQEPLRLVVQAAGGGTPAALPALPRPTRNQAAPWLALWLTGAALVALMQTRRQYRLACLGDRLPAGSSPALVGLLRPRLALPLDFETRFDAAERELVIAHEHVHRDRLDNLWNLLACAITALHWWNPLAWWAARRMHADQELACDAAVLAGRPGAATTYARALLAAHGLNALGAPLASRWGSSHPLVERIAMLNRPMPLTRRRALPLLLAITSLSALAYAGAIPATADRGYIRMQLALVLSEPGQKTTLRSSLIGRSGERLMLRFNAVKADKPGWTTQPLWISLWPEKQDGTAFIKTRISVGDPAMELGHPSLASAWGETARVEINGANPNERFVLELTPTELPADYQPPPPTATMPRS